ncbi:MAG: hypothetical protein ACTSV7_09840 [Candidatus Baldrarchaeia archaeon]
MVKLGYTCITVPIQLYEKLKEASKSLDLTIPKLIQQLIQNQSTSTNQEHILNLNLNNQNPSLLDQNNPNSSLNLENKEGKIVRNRRCLTLESRAGFRLRVQIPKIFSFRDL